MATTAPKIKRIIVLSDGTGNSAAKVWRTNVWRLYQALDLSNGRQVGLYDDGVGSSAFAPLAVLGGALGFGLKRNVLDLYRFVCRNWEDDAQIYGFGFSRGAFTIRVLMGLICNEGLVPFESESQLRRDTAGAYRSYRKRYQGRAEGSWLVGFSRAVRDRFLGAWNRLRGHRPYEDVRKRAVPAIRFLGLWDTVAAYGLPMEEMTRGVNQWLWPMSLPDRALNGKVLRACHALALDDERTTFHPMLWTERGEKAFRNVKNERISQVWFAGMHANVGGGYPDDALAHVSLRWMMEQARACDLEFKRDLAAIEDVRLASDQDGRLYDSRHGLAGYYRYGPRHLSRLTDDRDHDVVVTLPKIHESVFERIRHGARSYAPIGLPARYAVVNAAGDILELSGHSWETAGEAQARARRQERVWDLVWKRRVTYFATLVPSFYLASFPWIYPAASSPLGFLSAPIRALGSLIPDGPASGWGFLSGPIRVAGNVLPGFASRWVESFAANPGSFLLVALVLSGLMWLGGRRQGQIRDEMRTLWEARPTDAAAPDTWIYRVRTHPAYREFFRVVKRAVLPAFFALALVAGGLYLVLHGLVAVATSFGVL